MADGDGRYLLNMAEELFRLPPEKILDPSGLAKAVQKEATARYQQTVLTATADVETALGALRALVKRNEAQSRAESATTRGAKIARDRFKAGTSTYLEVIDAERGALSAQLTTAALKGERLATTVQLVKALGGG